MKIEQTRKNTEKPNVVRVVEYIEEAVLVEYNKVISESLKVLLETIKVITNEFKGEMDSINNNHDSLWIQISREWDAREVAHRKATKAYDECRDRVRKFDGLFDDFIDLDFSDRAVVDYDGCINIDNQKLCDECKDAVKLLYHENNLGQQYRLIMW